VLDGCVVAAARGQEKQVFNETWQANMPLVERRNYLEGYADAAAHHATEAKAAEAAGNEHAADLNTAAVAEHHQGVVEAVQAGETHGPSTLTTSSGKALPHHDAPSAAWDKATSGFTAAEHDGTIRELLAGDLEDGARAWPRWWR
jgi:hypothetical protein